jgi:hypothetical protein
MAGCTVSDTVKRLSQNAADASGKKLTRKQFAPVLQGMRTGKSSSTPLFHRKQRISKSKIGLISR